MWRKAKIGIQKVHFNVIFIYSSSFLEQTYACYEERN
jgi:hypothetical protein